MKKAFFLNILIITMLAFIPAAGFSHTCDSPFTTDLTAGGGNTASSTVVGDVEVCNDADNLYVKYVITYPDACLLETHLQVADVLEGIPQTKKGNPIPGQFDYSAEHDCVTEYTYTIPLNWGVDTDLYIAAHSVVQLANSVTTDACTSAVVASTQGLTKGGDPVPAIRSNPDSALGEPDGSVEGNFFSLGFGGNIVLSFPSLVGGDMSVYETTWGSSYPLETAQVYGSRDGENWTLLGVADNQPLPGDNSPIESVVATNRCIQYVKILDITDISLFASKPDTVDAFDLDAVCASYSCNEETAWGAGTDFPGKNWAMYFTYTIQATPCVKPDDSLSVTGTGWIADYAWCPCNYTYDLTSTGQPVALKGFIDTSAAAVANTNDWSKYYAKFIISDGDGSAVAVVFGNDWLGNWYEMPAQPWDRIRMENNMGLAQPSQYYATVGGTLGYDMDGTWVGSGNGATIYPSDHNYFIQLIADPVNDTLTLQVYGKGSSAPSNPPNAWPKQNMYDDHNWLEIGTINLGGNFDFSQVNLCAELWASPLAGAGETSTINYNGIGFGAPLSFSETPEP